MKKQYKTFLFVVVSLFIITFVVYIINDSFYFNIIEYFVKEKVSEHPESGMILKKIILLLLLKIIYLTISLGIIIIVNWNKILNFIATPKLIEFTKALIKKINYASKYYTVLILMFFSFLVLSLLFIFNMDIGTDEGFYISAIKNFYVSGKFNLPWREFAQFANQLIFIPFFILKYFIPFSNELSRIVILIYTFILFFLLYYIYKKYKSILGFVVIILLLISNSSFLFVSSSTFSEIPTLLFLIIGLYVFSKTKIRYRTIISAMFLAFACMSKLQILPILLLTIFTMYLIDSINKKKYIHLTLFLFTIWFLGSWLFSLLQGYSFTSIFKTFYILLNSSGQVAKQLPFFARISHLTNYFHLVNVIIVSIVLCYILHLFKKLDLFKKNIALFFIFNSIWWIFFYFSVSPRNLIYAIVFLYLLFSDAIIYFYNKLKTNKYKSAYKIFVTVFLLFNFLNGIVFSAIQIKKGISDEYLSSLIGYQTPFGDSGKIIRSNQKEFYETINNLDDKHKIYWISMDYNKYLFTDKEFIKIKKKDLFSLPKESYFILTYIDYRNNYVWDGLMIYLNNNAEIVFKKNYWEIYRINY